MTRGVWEEFSRNNYVTVSQEARGREWRRELDEEEREERGEAWEERRRKEEEEERRRKKADEDQMRRTGTPPEIMDKPIWEVVGEEEEQEEGEVAEVDSAEGGAAAAAVEVGQFCRAWKERLELRKELGERRKRVEEELAG